MTSSETPRLAHDWNARGASLGYVTRFQVHAIFLERYPVRVVGNTAHAEYWIPAEDLAEFNANIVGPIEVIVEFRGGEAVVDG